MAVAQTGKMSDGSHQGTRRLKRQVIDVRAAYKASQTRAACR